MLLNILTVQANHMPIYIFELGTLQDQVNAIPNQMNIIIEELNTIEPAICLLCTKLVEVHNVTNALAHAAPTTAATTTTATAASPTSVYIIDKILFPNKFNGT